MRRGLFLIRFSTPLFDEINLGLREVLTKILSALPHLAETLADPNVKKVPEYDFVTNIVDAWIWATGKLPTVTRAQSRGAGPPFSALSKKSFRARP